MKKFLFTVLLISLLIKTKLVKANSYDFAFAKKFDTDFPKREFLVRPDWANENGEKIWRTQIQAFAGERPKLMNLLTKREYQSKFLNESFKNMLRTQMNSLKFNPTNFMSLLTKREFRPPIWGGGHAPNNMFRTQMHTNMAFGRLSKLREGKSVL